MKHLRPVVKLPGGLEVGSEQDAPPVAIHELEEDLGTISALRHETQLVLTEGRNGFNYGQLVTIMLFYGMFR